MWVHTPHYFCLSILGGDWVKFCHIGVDYKLQTWHQMPSARRGIKSPVGVEMSTTSNVYEEEIKEVRQLLNQLLTASGTWIRHFYDKRDRRRNLKMA